MYSQSYSVAAHQYPSAFQGIAPCGWTSKTIMKYRWERPNLMPSVLFRWPLRQWFPFCAIPATNHGAGIGFEWRHHVLSKCIFCRCRVSQRLCIWQWWSWQFSWDSQISSQTVPFVLWSRCRISQCSIITDHSTSTVTTQFERFDWQKEGNESYFEDEIAVGWNSSLWMSWNFMSTVCGWTSYFHVKFKDDHHHIPHRFISL